MSDEKKKTTKKEFVVNVVGVPYRVHMGTTEDYPILEANHSSGLCDFSVKKIWVADSTIGASDVGDMIDQKYPTRLTLRHELFHALFHELGQEHYAENENLVNFMAMSIEKMYQVCKDAGAINGIKKAA